MRNVCSSSRSIEAGRNRGNPAAIAATILETLRKNLNTQLSFGLKNYLPISPGCDVLRRTDHCGW